MSSLEQFLEILDGMTEEELQRTILASLARREDLDTHRFLGGLLCKLCSSRSLVLILQEVMTLQPGGLLLPWSEVPEGEGGVRERRHGWVVSYRARGSYRDLNPNAGGTHITYRPEPEEDHAETRTMDETPSPPEEPEPGPE